MGEDYEGMGEFHDLFVADAWTRLRPVLAEAFSALDDTATVLDVGAGTGVGTLVLAGCTAARIVAVEPSRTMRAVLTARVADDPDLCGRVSIVADRVPGALAALQAPVAGFVCAHVLGHLTESDRRATFARIAAVMHPDGVGVVTTKGTATGTLDAVHEESRRIGDLTYVARHLRPQDLGTSVTEYDVLRNGRVIRRERFTAAWEPPSDEQLRAELTGAGLGLEVLGRGTGLVRSG